MLPFCLWWVTHRLRKALGLKILPGQQLPLPITHPTTTPTPTPHPLVVRQGNPDQLRLLQLPQPGTQQHRPHPHRRGRSDVHKLPTPGRPDGLTSQPNGHTTWWQRRHYGPHNDVVFTSCVRWAETPAQQHSWRSSHPPWWQTADQTTDARKNKRKRWIFTLCMT